MNSNIIVGDNYRFTILSDILIRMEYNLEGKFLDELTERVENRNFNVPKYNVQQDNKYLVIETSYFKLEYIKNKPFFGTKISPDQYLKVYLKNTDKIWYFGQAEARNFNSLSKNIDGMSDFKTNLKGLYSVDGFVSLDDSNSLIVKDNVFYKRNKCIDTYLFMYNRDFGVCLRDYFKLTGKPNMIPRYMFGNIWNKCTYYTDQNIKDLIKKFNKNKIPVNSILLGNDWHSKNNLKSGLSWNNDLFVDYEKFVKYLIDQNIYLGVTINPNEGISNKEKNFKLFSNNENSIKLNVFSKEESFKFIDSFIKPLTENGISFFLIDNKENNYFDRVLNFYINNFFKTNNKKSSILERNNIINNHNRNIVYTGNTLVNWKTLDNIPNYIISASNSGVSFVSTDIGGFSGGIEDDELYRRFVQYGTFSPILRLSSDSSSYYKREPWMWDLNTTNIVSKYLRMRCELIPYLYSEAYNYCETGLPITQPLYYKYPFIYDEILYKNEYYFGSSLLVCPITKQKDLVMNRTIHKMFLPEGIWYDFNTGIKYVGNRRYVSFYKDEDYPVYATQGSIIPLAILNDNNINSSNNPDGFVIHIFPGKTSSYTIYEDDGISLNKNKYVKTIIEYNYLLNNYTVIIRTDMTDSSLIPSIRSYKIRFRNTRLPNDISVYYGEDKFDNFKSYIEDNDFVVEINNVNSFKQITINSKGQDIEIESVRLINEDINSIISDLKINTSLKTDVNKIMFGELEIKKKRIAIRKLKRKKLHPRYITMFLKLLDYLEENI